MDGIGAGGIMYSNFEFGSSGEELDDRVMSRSVGDLDRSLESINMTEEILFQNDSYDYVNDTVYFEGEEMYSLGFKIAIAILYNSVFVTALLGNALVCYVIFASPRMRTVTNYLIANLAVGDLLMAVLCVPFSYIPVLLQYWPFGHFLCYLLPPAQAVSVLVSSYTLVALAADRYIAILYPLRPRFRRSQACWVIAVVWLVAVITASPIAIFTEHFPDNATGKYYCDETGWKSMGVEEFKLPYGLTLMILQYFFPLTVLIFTYSRIAVAVWGKKSLGEAEDSRDQRLAKTKRKMIKMMLTVVLVYTVSWLPLNIWNIYGDIWREDLFQEKAKVVKYLYPAILWLALAHTVWNPVIYCYMNSRFRDGFKAAASNVPCVWNLVRYCQEGRRSSGQMTDSRRSYSTTRLTRTNTSCTTYTFGSGSLHNLHNNSHYHHQITNPIRKHSYMGTVPFAGTAAQPRASCTSVISQYPKPGNHAVYHHTTRSLDLGNHHSVDPKNLKTLTQAPTTLAPAPTTPASSPSSPSNEPVNLPMTTLSHSPSYPTMENNGNNGNNGMLVRVKINNFDLNNKIVNNGTSGGGSTISPSFVTVSNKFGKDVLTTTNKSGNISESFM
ncbi:unnamed protein product [Orchesella dallaii]|uniref:G-protein coupled receptors family 1 profile domain-containing protein n=1 Tax=Orchesella dallaii TaxID=48710 RepID=A0ABP1PUN9_9HEXA